MRHVRPIRHLRLVPVVLALAAIVLISQLASAAPVAEGKQWRELYETTGLTRAQVATVCPTDGVTPCSGSVGGHNLSGWVWATADQVRALMDDYGPALSDPAVPAVTGIEGFFAASAFLGEMRWTTYTSLTYFYSEYTGGWTSSLDDTGLPIAGAASMSHAMTGTTADGSLGLGAREDGASPYDGVFLWRSEGLDYTPPTVTPTVTGTLGNNGWYRSDVGVSWSVSDTESAIVATTGCEPSVVSLDTAGASFTCTATSAGLGGSTSGTVSVKRDVTTPTVTCGPAPTFTNGQAGATVTATVADALSGPVAATVSAVVSTSVVGSQTATLIGADRAGNQRAQQCGYTVTGATCKGKAVTIPGTGGNDSLTGTAGDDVIHGFGGNDRINGLGGNDAICGGDGADLLLGDKGADVIDGGAGNDEIEGGDGDDDLDGGAGSDSIRGDNGADRCTSGELRMSSCSSVY
jgi:Ca2+-binding RTX toxin-like protein